MRKLHEKRGQIFAWFYVAIPVGSALGYVLGGWANAMWSWRAGFYLVVPPGLILAALCLLKRDVRNEPAKSGEPNARRIATPLNALIRNPSYILDTLGMTAMTFAIGGGCVLDADVCIGAIGSRNTPNDCD